jgi:hypothetical protein
MRHGRILPTSVRSPGEWAPNRKKRTEDADGIPLVIILHEELVTVYNMLAEIPCEHDV